MGLLTSSAASVGWRVAETATVAFEVSVQSEKGHKVANTCPGDCTEALGEWGGPEM